MKICAVDECGRKLAAHGLCLMHYKRVQKHGSTDYRWGGRVIGRACLHCKRQVIARELCSRHYQMWQRHGDPLYSDSRKVGGFASGTHARRGYKMVTPSANIPVAVAGDAKTERGDAPARRANNTGMKLRDGSKRSRREWEHRKIANAQMGEVVHHIDLVPSNNDPTNLHVFGTISEHVRAHRSLDLLTPALISLGIIVFNRATGCYRLRESASQAKP